MNSWFSRFGPFDKTDYYMPVVRHTTTDGDRAEGPMIRQGSGRKELLVWLNRDAAEAAARELVAQVGGTFKIRLVKRKDVEAECRTYSSWGGKVVAVILK